MNPYLILLAIPIPIISFFFQSYPRFFNKYFGVDVWIRLIETDLVRKSGHKIPNGKIKNGFIIEGHFDYPPVFPFLLSFIPKAKLIKIQGFIAPFFDSLNNFLVFLIAFFITGRPEIAIFAQLLYTLTPLIALENSNLTPRSLGYLNFNLAFFPLLIYTIRPEVIFLATATFFAFFLFLTHRFAAQSFLFIVLFFSIFEKNPIYFLVFLISFLAAVILTKGYYLRVLKGHLTNIYFWVKNYNFRFAHQVRIMKDKEADLVAKLYKLLTKFPPLTILVADIWLTAAFFVFFSLLFNFQLPVNPFIFKLSIWVVFFYLLASLVLLVKFLRPIGEGQRYIEMATVPVSILSSWLFFQMVLIYSIPVIFFYAVALFANLTIIIFLQIKSVIHDKNRSLTESMKKVFDYINKKKGDFRILCLPHQTTPMVVYNTKAKVLINIDNHGLLKLTDFYPVLKKPIDEIIQEWKINHLLIRESFVTLAELKLKRGRIVAKSGDIILIKV